MPSHATQIQAILTRERAGDAGYGRLGREAPAGAARRTGQRGAGAPGVVGAQAPAARRGSAGASATA